MIPTTLIASDVPLRRLLKRRDADQLLAQFAALLPEGDLALVSATGHVYSGSGAWNQAELGDLLAQRADGTMMVTVDLFLLPLLLDERLVAAVVARNAAAAPEQTTAQVLRCLHSSLTLLLEQAIAQRDIVRETLDRYREISLLYRIGETIGACLDPEAIPQLVLEEVCPVVQADAGMMLLPLSATAVNQAELVTKASFGDSDFLEDLRLVSRRVLDQVLAAGQPAIVTGAHLPQIGGVTGSVGALLCAPLKAQGSVLGALLLGRQTDKPEFTAGDEKLAMALTGQAAIALETARLHQEEVTKQRLEEELAIARQIQLSLLPASCPTMPGWEFAAVYHSARQVGGDLYDFISSPNDAHLLNLVIADVTGKGMPAALFMAFSRTVLRAESSTGLGPAATLRRTNRFIVQDIRSGLFLSAFYAELNTRNGRLAYANGGHDWPLWLRADSGEIVPLSAPGFVLGAFKDIRLEEREITVAPGDSLILFTDGVTEARNVNGQLFGEERLQRAITADPNASAQQMLQTIVSAVEDFMGAAPQSDDLTLFVVKRQR